MQQVCVQEHKLGPSIEKKKTLHEQHTVAEGGHGLHWTEYLAVGLRVWLVWDDQHSAKWGSV